MSFKETDCDAAAFRDPGRLKPLSTPQTIWLARGAALGTTLRLLQHELRTCASQLRDRGPARRLHEIGLRRPRLPEG